MPVLFNIKHTFRCDNTLPDGSVQLLNTAKVTEVTDWYHITNTKSASANVRSSQWLWLSVSVRVSDKIHDRLV